VSAGPEVERCQALIQLDLIARRIDLALDRKDRRWFEVLIRLRADQKRRLTGE
jgi:uncharacterized protein YpiB (UPF0302 family)